MFGSTLSLEKTTPLKQVVEIKAFATWRDPGFVDDGGRLEGEDVPDVVA